MACLDTSFLIDLLRGKRNVFLLKDELDKTETRLTIASLSIMELWAGAIQTSSEKEKVKINQLLQSLEILPFDESSAKEAAEIEAELASKGLIVGTEDIMIAGIAKVNGEKVVTADAHYTRIHGLKVLKY